MNEESNAPLDRLVEDYFDGLLDPASLQRLDGALRNSEEARQRFWQRAELEQALEGWGRRHSGKLTALAESRPSGTWWRQWAMLGGWAAAAVLLVMWLIQLRPAPPSGEVNQELAEAGPPPAPAIETTGYPVAFISQLVGVKSEGRYLAGQSVGAGDAVNLREGLMEIVFYSGARVTVEGPARLVPTSDLELTVLEGEVQADVPESAIGFKMVLPDGVVTDFGTSFEVKVEEDRASRVQVLDGEIEFAGQDPGQKVRRLTKGQAVSFVGEGQLEPVDFTPLAVGDSLAELAAIQGRVRMERWLKYGKRIDRDERVVAHFSLLPEESGADVILNHTESSKAPRSGTVISADWSEGRWSGKPALSFRRPADRVRIDIPGEFPQATFVAWVRIDGLPRDYNGLFYSEFGIEGEAHWQFSSDGRYYFGVRPKGSLGVRTFHRAFSEPVISPWAFGSWRMLATTYDSQSREVVHFVDAAEVSRTTLEDSVPLRFGRATLGNFFDPLAEQHTKFGQGWSFRNWSGAIDEFILYSKVVPVEELVELHEVGRVD